MGLKSDSLMQVNHRLHRHHHLLHHDHHHDHHDHHRLFGEPSFQDKTVESFVSYEVKMEVLGRYLKFDWIFIP